MTARELVGSAIAVVAVMSAVIWLRMQPAHLAGVERQAALMRSDDAAVAAPGEVERRNDLAELRDAYRFRGDDGREHVYLGGFDSYAWAIAARKLEATGSVCDQVVAGVCRDLTSLAPTGRAVHYPRSLHVRAIAAAHRLAEWWRPGTPLLSAMTLVPAAVAAAAVLPAFALGFRLAGWLGGLIVAVVSGFNSLLLRRTLNGDNDVWSFLFPLLLAWLVVEAILARRAAVAIAIAAAAGLAVGPYSTIWNGWPFAWSIALVGLIANVVLQAATRRPAGVPASGGESERADVATGLMMVLAFVVAAGVSTAVAGASPSYLDALPALFDNRLLSAPAEAAGGPPLQWPDAFARVGELRSTGLDEVAAWFGGRIYLFIGWIGLLLMLMPRRGWLMPHFATFLGGILLYRLLLSVMTSGRPSRLWLVGALAAPLVVAIALYAFDARDGARRRASISIVVWFVAALFLGLGSMRFLLLLVAPFAVAIAVAFDRLRGWVLDRGQPSTRAADALAMVSTVVAAALVLSVPVRAGWHTARVYLPPVNDAWYATLSGIRDTSPADAIVSTWWSYGYIAAYFSQRPVTADGGTLYSSAPYWTARAMMAASERESAGILRMLHCGGAAGAGAAESSPQFAALLAAGLSPYRALGVIDDLVRVDRAAAHRALDGAGLSPASIERVLAVTHCQPPASYLVLSDLDGSDFSWQRMAMWSFVKARAAAARRGASGAAADLEAAFGLDRAAAGAVMAAAEAAAREGRSSDFPVEMRALAPSRWMPCSGSGDALECPMRRGGLSGLDLRLDDPSASRLRGAAASGAPSLVVIDGEAVYQTGSAAARRTGWGLMFDTGRRRALIGGAAVLGSTWARLALLGGDGTELFEKVEDHAAAGERVTAWRVRWAELVAGDE